MFDYLKKLFGFESPQIKTGELVNLEIKPLVLKPIDLPTLNIPTTMDLLRPEHNAFPDLPKIKGCIVIVEPTYPNQLNIEGIYVNSIPKPVFHPGEPGKNNGFVFFNPRNPVQIMPEVNFEVNSPEP